MRIGIDADQVLVDFLTPLLEFHNSAYGTKNDFSEFETKNLEMLWRCDKRESLEKLHEFYNTEYFQMIKPIPGAVEAVNHLSKNHELYVVTSRTVKHADKTNEQIQKYFPNMFKEILFDNRYSDDNSIEIRKKAEVCKEYNLDIMIDDIPKNIENLPSDIKGILMDQPWNKNDFPKNTIRAYDWDDVLKIIKHVYL